MGAVHNPSIAKMGRRGLENAIFWYREKGGGVDWLITLPRDISEITYDRYGWPLLNQKFTFVSIFSQYYRIVKMHAKIGIESTVAMSEKSSRQKI